MFAGRRMKSTRKHLVLFDIDETMLKSDGAGRRAITSALSQACGAEIDSSAVKLSGKTDPQICREILEANGLSPEEIPGGLTRVFEIYLPNLEKEIGRSQLFCLHEGVMELLAALAEIDSACLGLLTGNIEPGARAKLSPFGINHYFPVGAYGSDSADRMMLPAVAGLRASKHFATEFRPRDVVIVGDSVHDVRCARGFGAVSIAVATGRTSWQEIEEAGPDFLFPSLSDTEALIQAILAE